MLLSFRWHLVKKLKKLQSSFLTFVGLLWFPINSIYAYYMKQLNFIFPATKPIYKILTARVHSINKKNKQHKNLMNYHFSLSSAILWNKNKNNPLWTLRKIYYVAFLS